MLPAMWIRQFHGWTGARPASGYPQYEDSPADWLQRQFVTEMAAFEDWAAYAA